GCAPSVRASRPVVPGVYSHEKVLHSSRHLPADITPPFSLPQFSPHGRFVSAHPPPLAGSLRAQRQPVRRNPANREQNARRVHIPTDCASVSSRRGGNRVPSETSLYWQARLQHPTPPVPLPGRTLRPASRRKLPGAREPETTAQTRPEQRPPLYRLPRTEI